MIDIGKIDRIEQIVTQMRSLDKELSELDSGDDATIARLAEIYDKAVELSVVRKWSVSQLREYYMFVVLYLYDSTALVRKLKRGGVRESIALVMGVTINNVSHLTKNLLFHYRLYKAFRTECDVLYNKINE